MLEQIDFNHSLIICPDDLKRKLLEYFYNEKKLFDVKFMDLQEYRKNICFDYDIRAIRYLKDNYNLSIANAREVLDNLCYVESGKEYGNEKLNSLSAIRKQLEDNYLLIYNPLFNKAIRDRKIYVCGYGKLKDEDRKITDGEVIEYEYNEKKYQISTFEDIEKEVGYLYDSIYKLISEKNVDINKIFVLGNVTDYESYFRRFNEYYGFTIEVHDDERFIGTKKALDFIEDLDIKNKEELFEKYKDDERIINVLNRYPGYELKEIKDFIISDLKKIRTDNELYRNTVKCEKMFTDFEDDEYVFLIGFNDQIPSLKRDTDYLSDNNKKQLDLTISEDENALIRYNARAYLSGINNLHISFSEKSPFKKYNLSNLFNENEYELIKVEENYDISEAYNRLRYGSMLDRLYRYNDQDEKLSSLYETYRDNDYLEYDNSFNGLSNDQINAIDNVRLSYSSMDKFFKCQFAYYIENILGLKNQEETFYTKTGTLCHEVLKDLYEDKNFDFESSWQNNIKKLSKDQSFCEDEKEEFFTGRIKEELKKDIEILKHQRQDSMLDKQMCEKLFKNEINDRVSFVGFIDKVMYYEGKNEIVANVIDYKTGTVAKINEKLMPYGMSLQLPSYMYLLRKDNPFTKKIAFGGFYLQHLINSEIKYDENKDLSEIKKESMKLDGYTTADPDRLSICDFTAAEGVSQNIRGLKLKKDGSFYAYSKVLDDEEMDGMVKLVEGKIDEAKDAILKGEFKINPKEIDNRNESCGYCPYGMICFKRYSDLVYISTGKEDESDGEVD